MNTRIKQLRELLDLSQNEFADKLNLKRNSISRIETGNRNPSDRTIIDICKTFHVNESWLRNGEGEIFSNPTAKNFNELIAIMNDLSDELQEYILNQAKSLLNLQNSNTFNNSKNPSK